MAIIREMGVECGGSNVQMGINPVDGELLLVFSKPFRIALHSGCHVVSKEAMITPVVGRNVRLRRDVADARAWVERPLHAGAGHSLPVGALLQAR